MRRVAAAEVGAAILASVLGARPAEMVQPASAPCNVRYVANAGVMLTTGTHTLLVDAPIREGIPPYAVPDAPERERLERARPPYERVSAILITHWHADHFSAPAVASHLRHNPAAVLVSSQEVVARVRDAWPDMPENRARASTPEPGRSLPVQLDGLRVHVLRIRHNPARVTPAQHVGFLVEGCRTILHIGDADPSADNFALLRPLTRVDVALVPWWFLTGQTNRAMTAAAIAPGRSLALHVSPREAGEVASALSSMPEVVVLSAAGQTVDLR